MSSNDHTWKPEYARKDAPQQFDCRTLGEKVTELQGDLTQAQSELRLLHTQSVEYHARIVQLETESAQAAFAAAELHRRLAALEKGKV
jgi:lipase chaperone LimK